MTTSLIATIQTHLVPCLALCGIQIVVGLGGFFTYRRHARRGGRRSSGMPVRANDWGIALTSLALLQYAMIAAGTVIVLAATLPPNWTRGAMWIPLVVYFATVGMMTAAYFPSELPAALLRVVTPLVLALLVQLAAGDSAEHAFWSELIYTGAYFAAVIPVMLAVLFATVGRHQVAGGTWVINVLLIGALTVLPVAIAIELLPQLFGRDPVAWSSFAATAALMVAQHVRAWWRSVKPVVDAGVI